MSLLVRGSDGGALVTPESAGWDHVGFEALTLADGQQEGRGLDGREACIVLLSGRAVVRSDGAAWALGGRSTPFDGLPSAAYLPPGRGFTVEAERGGAEVALCFARARRGVAARLIAARSIGIERRGAGAMERRVHQILMEDAQAESLLVTEVLTPAGHWSSYPPHKHDRDAPPEETYLEETYYHRIRPAHGFALQRVYTEDRSLDETVAVGDGDVVLVPRGYHTVSAPPGYALYYLNVMAGPRREWRIRNDPDHEWLVGGPAAGGRGVATAAEPGDAAGVAQGIEEE